MERVDNKLFEKSLSHAAQHHTGASLDNALEELGWRDALAIDPHAAIATLFELQGAANGCSSALETVLISFLGLELDSVSGVVLPAVGGWGPPGELDGGQLVVRGLGTTLADRESAVVVTESRDKHAASIIPLASLSLRPLRGIDPSYGLMEVTGEVAEGESEVVEWRRAVSFGQLVLGHELVGASRKMLELAREHALNRIQFGQPICRFQAVRHRLADTLVAIETANAMLDAAWLDRSPQTAATAKALAGRGARIAARHCQQVLAGIGFTTEHPLHRYIRRVLVLDQMLGASRSLTKQLGDQLLADRRLPVLLPL